MELRVSVSPGNGYQRADGKVSLRFVKEFAADGRVEATSRAEYERFIAHVGPHAPRNGYASWKWRPRDGWRW